jgi:hypothetical protein
MHRLLNHASFCRLLKYFFRRLLSPPTPKPLTHDIILPTSNPPTSWKKILPTLNPPTPQTFFRRLWIHRLLEHFFADFWIHQLLNYDIFFHRLRIHRHFKPLFADFESTDTSSIFSPTLHPPTPQQSSRLIFRPRLKLNDTMFFDEAVKNGAGDGYLD